MTAFPAVGSPQAILIAWSKLLQALDIANFRRSSWVGTILPGEEKIINHNLERIPGRYLITLAKGTPLLVRGDGAWTDTKITLRNVALISTFEGEVTILL